MRVADDDDPLRGLLRAARAWRVAPTVFIGARKPVTVYDHDSAGRIVRSTTTDWTQQDTELALALEVHEAGLCPGGDHVLAETSRPEYEGAYRPAGDPIRCHECTGMLLASEAVKDRKEADALFNPVALDLEVVERNLMPVPPLPPELQP